MFQIFSEGVPTAYVVLRIISLVLINIVGIFYLNQMFYLIGSLFLRKKKYPVAKKQHAFTYVVSARNEEMVIGQLIDSINKQNYPKELINIFVVADNCTDLTAVIAREHGAIVYERFNDKLKGKSYALNYLFNKIAEDYPDLNTEAYVIFDADNLLDKNYTLEINKVYDKGYKVATSYRASKNFSDSWISGGSSYMYYRECRQVHRVRTAINSGTYVSGTGYYVDKSIIDRNQGWTHHTLVEDIEFSTDAAIHNEKIAFCEDAVFYDEQPATLRASLRQRMRWCKGTHQVCGKYEGKLVKSMFKKFTFAKWDMLAHISPLPVITMFWVILYALLGGVFAIYLEDTFVNYWNYVLSNALAIVFVPCALALVDALILAVQVWNKNYAPWYKKIWYAITFPLFMLFYIPVSCIALFKKVTWKEIKHDRAKSIDDLENNNS